MFYFDVHVKTIINVISFSMYFYFFTDKNVDFVQIILGFEQQQIFWIFYIFWYIIL